MDEHLAGEWFEHLREHPLEGFEIWGLLGHGASLWSSHRALVAAAASGATTRLEIADGGPAGDAGGLVDEVAALELTFATAMLVAGEVVPGHTEFQPLRDQLGQAATAAANNDPVAKAAALAAFVAAVNALPAGSVDPRDAALLVAIAGVL